MGASYIGTGAFFETKTKKDASRITLESFKEIREALLIPVFPIGGISKDNLDFFTELDLDGLCMSRAIFSVREDEVEKNVREIIEKLKNL